jgi:hypothetical protein
MLFSVIQWSAGIQHLHGRLRIRAGGLFFDVRGNHNLCRVEAVACKSCLKGDTRGAVTISCTQGDRFFLLWANLGNSVQPPCNLKFGLESIYELVAQQSVTSFHLNAAQTGEKPDSTRTTMARSCFSALLVILRLNMVTLRYIVATVIFVPLSTKDMQSQLVARPSSQDVIRRSWQCKSVCF